MHDLAKKKLIKNCVVTSKLFFIIIAIICFNVEIPIRTSFILLYFIYPDPVSFVPYLFRCAGITFHSFYNSKMFSSSGVLSFCNKKLILANRYKQFPKCNCTINNWKKARFNLSKTNGKTLQKAHRRLLQVISSCYANGFAIITNGINKGKVKRPPTFIFFFAFLFVFGLIL